LLISKKEQQLSRKKCCITHDLTGYATPIDFSEMSCYSLLHTSSSVYISFALQLCTVRFLGTFLSDPTDVPHSIILTLASQLNIADLTVLARYLEGQMRYDHVHEIMQEYGYQDFASQPEHFRFLRWLYTRAWWSEERLTVLFDLAMAHLIDRKVLLPGVSVLERAVSSVREHATTRLWQLLAQLPTPRQVALLETLLVVPEGERQTPLDRLRRAPARVSGPALVQALHRVDAIRLFEMENLDLSFVPRGRLKVLARHAATAFVHNLRQLADDHRIATLLAFASTYLAVVHDDALSVVCGQGGKCGRMRAKEAGKKMTKRIEVAAAPAPLEEYAQHFDGLFGKSNQREGFRRYVEGLLLPGERHKTLTGLTNTEPVVGAQLPRAQRLQWFLSESDWDEREVQAERLRLLRQDAASAPTAKGVLVIDETGDRKDGHNTAHVSRQYLANLGKIDNGVVSVSSLWADEGIYYPVDFEPYTPAVYFAKGKHDPQFRTKLKIALQLVERALKEEIPFRAMVADSFYGEDRTLRSGLRKLSVPYVMALKPSHAWWHPQEVAGTLQDVAQEAGWESAQHPGKWVPITRTFRDGSTQDWWALEIVAGPYGPNKTERAIVATTDPQTLPDLSTWYLVSNLPALERRLEAKASFPAADLPEIIRLYGLRMWVEQSYKHVKHALGWSQYQVRSDKAIRRHWQLVWCAFSFCWYHASHPQAHPTPEAKAASEPAVALQHRAPAQAAATGKKNQRASKNAATALLASSAASRERLAGTLDHAQTLLERLVASAPTSCVAASAHMA